MPGQPIRVAPPVVPRPAPCVKREQGRETGSKSNVKNTCMR